MASKSSLPARILLVDNNTNGLKARKAVLEEHGYHVVGELVYDDDVVPHREDEPDDHEPDEREHPPHGPRQ